MIEYLPYLAAVFLISAAVMWFFVWCGKDKPEDISNRAYEEEGW